MLSFCFYKAWYDERKLAATFFLMVLFCLQQLSAGYLEVNASLDYFRGMPDGTWNGNNGALIAVNSAMRIGRANFQLGGSYGLYDWDGRGNLVFANPKIVEQVGFLTVGASSCWKQWTGGIVYDRLFSSHFGIFVLHPTIDQLRFQLGYLFCSEEFGAWGTLGLNEDRQYALGIPVSFKAMGQINLFWRHFFQNCAQTQLWIGLPYEDSLMYHHQRPGKVIVGASFRVPLLERLLLDGNASYMAARNSPGVVQSRNYGFSMCLGITYCFNSISCKETPYMPIANHSNFFVDTNHNQ